MPNRTITQEPEKLFNYNDFDQNWLPERLTTMPIRDKHTKQNLKVVSTKPNVKNALRRSYYGK